MMGLEEVPEPVPEGAIDITFGGEERPEYYPPRDDDPFYYLRHPKHKRFCETYARTGSRRKAARSVGIQLTSSYGPFWKDKTFLQAFELAKQIYLDTLQGDLEDEARHRAIKGDRKYIFNHGEPVRHPEKCECGHSRRDHPSGGSCVALGCECQTFIAAPYYDAVKSDRLLTKLLEAEVPDKYVKRMEFKGALANLDLTRLSNESIARIVAGENPMAVLAELVEAGELPALEAGPGPADGEGEG